ncbi:MAG: hypothetical protein R6X02_31735 [Enhygromyxa sp.]
MVHVYHKAALDRRLVLPVATGVEIERAIRPGDNRNTGTVALAGAC